MNSIINDSLAFALPLFIIAIGGIYCEGSGVINLALEGLLGVGAFFGGLSFAMISTQIGTTTNSMIYISLIFSMIGGGLFAILYALLAIRFKANQVISGVVINMLSVSLTAFLANQLNYSLFGQASNKFMLAVFPRVTVPFLNKVPVIGAFFNETYVFEYIIIAIAFIMWFVLYKTPYGMSVRACGDNPQAVATAGRDVNKIRFSAVIISGVMAGIGGMCFAYSISTNFSPSIYVGYGYLAIAAYIFGNYKIGQTLLACLIFGFARTFGYLIVQALALPSTYSDLALTFPYIVTLVLLIFFSKNFTAPKGLGEVYEKSKR
ncbi:MAG: ABC transporter permease [Sphaerochaeta sp.]|jgi:simple sugar transport system permease protein